MRHVTVHLELEVATTADMVLAIAVATTANVVAETLAVTSDGVPLDAIPIEVAHGGRLHRLRDVAPAHVVVEYAATFRGRSGTGRIHRQRLVPVHPAEPVLRNRIASGRGRLPSSPVSAVISCFPRCRAGSVRTSPTFPARRARSTARSAPCWLGRGYVGISPISPSRCSERTGSRREWWRCAHRDWIRWTSTRSSRHASMTRGSSSIPHASRHGRPSFGLRPVPTRPIPRSSRWSPDRWTSPPCRSVPWSSPPCRQTAFRPGATALRPTHRRAVRSGSIGAGEVRNFAMMLPWDGRRSGSGVKTSLASNRSPAGRQRRVERARQRAPGGRSSRCQEPR